MKALNEWNVIEILEEKQIFPIFFAMIIVK